LFFDELSNTIPSRDFLFCIDFAGEIWVVDPAVRIPKTDSHINTLFMKTLRFNEEHHLFYVSEKPGKSLTGIGYFFEGRQVNHPERDFVLWRANL